MVYVEGINLIMEPLPLHPMLLLLLLLTGPA